MVWSLPHKRHFSQSAQSTILVTVNMRWRKSSIISSALWPRNKWDSSKWTSKDLMASVSSIIIDWVMEGEGAVFINL